MCLQWAAAAMCEKTDDHVHGVVKKEGQQALAPLTKQYSNHDEKVVPCQPETNVLQYVGRNAFEKPLGCALDKHHHCC